MSCSFFFLIIISIILIAWFLSLLAYIYIDHG